MSPEFVIPEFNTNTKGAQCFLNRLQNEITTSITEISLLLVRENACFPVFQANTTQSTVYEL